MIGFCPPTPIVLASRGGSAEASGMALSGRVANVTLSDAVDASADINSFIGAEAKNPAAPMLEMG